MMKVTNHLSFCGKTHPGITAKAQHLDSINDLVFGGLSTTRQESLQRPTDRLTSDYCFL